MHLSATGDGKLQKLSKTGNEQVYHIVCISLALIGAVVSVDEIFVLFDMLFFLFVSCMPHE